MSLWNPQIAGRTGPVYRAIVDALAEDVATGQLAVGAKLPPHRDLAWRLQVTVGTVARAYAEAARRGLVTGEVGRGTFVREPERGDGPRHVHDYVASRPLGADAAIDMAINRPTGDNCAGPIADAFRRLADRPDLSALLGYQMDHAMPRFRAAGRAWASLDGVVCRPEQVVPSIGCQQAIIAMLGALSRPGDVILAEELTYPGLKVAAALLGRSVEGVAIDDQGLRPDALDEALGRLPGGGRVVYCMPTVHNPTVVTMPLERRQAIVAVARRHEAILVEDGIYAFLADTPPPPLWTLAPERVVYITSLSKAVAPALRLGFAIAPDRLVGLLAAAVSASTVMLAAPLAEIGAMLIEQGAAADAARAQKHEVLARLRVAEHILGPASMPPHPAFNLWLPLPSPWRADAFAAEAYRRGVVVSPAASFATTRHVPEAVRISVSAPRDHEELRHGLHLLRQLLDSPPDAVGMTV